MNELKSEIRKQQSIRRNELQRMMKRWEEKGNKEIDLQILTIKKWVDDTKAERLLQFPVDEAEQMPRTRGGRGRAQEGGAVTKLEKRQNGRKKGASEEKADGRASDLEGGEGESSELSDVPADIAEGIFEAQEKEGVDADGKK